MCIVNVNNFHSFYLFISLNAAFLVIYASLHTISGQNQADNHLPEIVFFCAVISAVWNFVKGYNAVFFIQPRFRIRERLQIAAVRKKDVQRAGNFVARQITKELITVSQKSDSRTSIA